MIPRPAPLLAALALGAAALPAAADAAAPVVLDPAVPVDAAATGTTLAWLRAVPADPDHPALVVREADGGTRVLPQRLPTHAASLTVGTDADGAPTAVVGTRGGRLYRLPLDGTAAPSRLPASAAAGAEAAPGLRRGVLTFARRERLREGTRWTVRLGTLAERSSRLVSRGASGLTVRRTAPVAVGRVAYVTARVRGEATRLQIRLLRAGAASRLLAEGSSGPAAEAGVGPLTVTPGGSRLTASRWQDGGGHPWGTTTWRSSGTVVERHRQRPSIARELRLGTVGTAVIAGDAGGLAIVPAG